VVSVTVDTRLRRLAALCALAYVADAAHLSASTLQDIVLERVTDGIAKPDSATSLGSLFGESGAVILAVRRPG